MDTQRKLKPLTTDITFCEHPSAHKNVQCAFCARNLNRYEIRKCFRISVFAEPPCAFTASDCDYYLQDARQPEE